MSRTSYFACWIVDRTLKHVVLSAVVGLGVLVATAANYLSTGQLSAAALVGGTWLCGPVVFKCFEAKDGI